MVPCSGRNVVIERVSAVRARRLIARLILRGHFKMPEVACGIAVLLNLKAHIEPG